MSTATDLHRTITDLDHVRIFNLLRRQTAAGGAPEHARDLAELIDAAEQVRPPSRSFIRPPSELYN